MSSPRHPPERLHYHHAGPIIQRGGSAAEAMDSENSKKPSAPLPSQPSPRPATSSEKSTQKQRRAATAAFDPHRHHLYHGRAASNITSHLKQRIPTHSFDPQTQQERQQNPAAHRKKASSITGWMEPHPKLQRPVTAPLQYFGRRPTSVTGFVRQIPPQPSPRALPYFGKHRTSVTDPSKCKDPADADADAGAGILTHCLTDRPSGTRASPSPARRHRAAAPSLCSDESRDAPGPRPSPPRDEEDEKELQSTAGADGNPTGAFRLPATPRSARASNAPSSSSSKKSCSMRATRGSVSCPSTPRQKGRHGANSHASLLGRAAEVLARGSAAGPGCAKRNDEDDGLQSSRESVAESNLSSVCDSLGAERAEYVSHWAGQLQSWAVTADRHAEPSRGARPVDHMTPAVSNYSRRATSVTRLCIF